MPDDPTKGTSADPSLRPTEESPYSVRRRAPRYPVVATAVVTELGTGARLEARISELGRNGCYVDTLNPFPVGTLVTVKIVKDEGAYETPARVLYIHPGYGMGVLFTDSPVDQRAVLEAWLAELSA